MKKNTYWIWWQGGRMTLPLQINKSNQKEALEIAKEIVKSLNFEGHFEVYREYKNGVIRDSGLKFARGTFNKNDYENLNDCFKVRRKAQ